MNWYFCPVICFYIYSITFKMHFLLFIYFSSLNLPLLASHPAAVREEEKKRHGEFVNEELQHVSSYSGTFKQLNPLWVKSAQL